VLSDPAAVSDMGGREAGALLEARVLRHDADGLAELAVSGGRLVLGEIAAPVGARLRVRIRASDVILAVERPHGLSALNVLEGVVEAVGAGEGPAAEVALRCGEDRILARLTRRSVAALALAPGRPCFAILKAVAVAAEDVGVGGPAGP
jgi:molybdate transport system ATP-binding protein